MRHVPLLNEAPKVEARKDVYCSNCRRPWTIASDADETTYFCMSDNPNDKSGCGHKGLVAVTTTDYELKRLSSGVN